VADYEVTAWRGTALSLARVATFLVDPQAHHQLATSVSHAVTHVYRRSYQPHGWAERVLLLTRALASQGLSHPPLDPLASDLAPLEAAAAAAAARGGGWLARMMSRIGKEGLGELVAVAEAALQVSWAPLGWKALTEEAAAAALVRLELAVGALVEVAAYRFRWASHSAATAEGFLWRVLEQLGEGPRCVASYQAGDIDTMQPRELAGFTGVLAAAAACAAALNTPEQLEDHLRREFAAFTLRKKPVEAAVVVGKALQTLLHRTELAEARALTLRHQSLNLYNALVAAKWTAVQALLGVEVKQWATPSSPVFYSEQIVMFLPPQLIAQVLGTALLKLDMADQVDLPAHLFAVRALLPAVLDDDAMLAATAAHLQVRVPCRNAAPSEGGSIGYIGSIGRRDARRHRRASAGACALPQRSTK
jgi:hypothetical protein